MQKYKLRISTYIDKTEQGKTTWGVAIYLKKGLVADPCRSLSIANVEMICIKVKELKTILYSAYRPGEASHIAFEEVMTTLLEELVVISPINWVLGTAILG